MGAAPNTAGKISRRVKRAGEEVAEIIPFGTGYGPLLERNYWATIKRSRLKPSEVIRKVKANFHEFAPGELAAFRKQDEGKQGDPICLNDILDIRLGRTAHCQVKVVHEDRCSFTLATIEGHPEAGKITFGAYRNERGDVIFHIRSRARSSRAHYYLGWLTIGEGMQTNTWAEFVNRVAFTAGEGPVSVVHADTHEIPLEQAPRFGGDGPTYRAEGD